MCIRAARPLLGLQTSLILTLTASASSQGPQSLWDLTDIGLRNEIATLGPYLETDDPFLRDSLVHLPLRSSSPLHIEFAAADVRVRLEAFPYEHSAWVKKRKDGSLWLEQRPVISWGNDEQHMRLSRAEIVVDGIIRAVPSSEFLDVFDPIATTSEYPEHWCTVARSKDGSRLYLQVLAGAGSHARCITWVFEHGEYLFRVVDPWEE
jgi:hypothetical protein